MLINPTKVNVFYEIAVILTLKTLKSLYLILTGLTL